MSSKVEDFDFEETIDFCRTLGMSLLKTDDLRLQGVGHVTIIQFDGAQASAAKLLKISEQLARLHTTLTQSSKKDK